MCRDKYIINNILDKNVKYKLTKNMELNDIINTICEKFKSPECAYNISELKNVIIGHSNRVLKNAFNIIDYKIDNNEYYKESINIELLFIAISLHDIGKAYKKENHSQYSGYIVEYLLENNIIKFKYNKYNQKIKEELIDIIVNHGDKKYNKEFVSQSVKIMRDADTLDENCGESLVDLALRYSKTKDKDAKKCNLNKINYSKSDAIMTLKTNEKYINKIIKKLNDPISINFYRDQIKLAKKEYDEKTRDTRGDYLISMDELILSIKHDDWFKEYLEIVTDEL